MKFTLDQAFYLVLQSPYLNLEKEYFQLDTIEQHYFYEICGLATFSQSKASISLGISKRQQLWLSFQRKYQVRKKTLINQ